MAKKKSGPAAKPVSKAEIAKRNKSLETRIEAGIIKEFGEGILSSCQRIVDNAKMVIPVSPALDIVLGGGIPEGSWVISSGKAKCGKTTSALTFAANCQKPEYGARKVFYMDVEGRLKKMNLTGIRGLDPDGIFRIGSVKGKILTAENYLDIAERVIHDEPGCLLIIDSSSALCAEKEMVSAADGQQRPAGPKLLGQFCRKMGNVVPVNNTIVWVVQHMYTNTSGKGEAMIEDGGVKIDYQRDIKIRCKWVEKWTTGSGEEGQIIGQKLHWQMLSSALGGIPNSQCTSYLRYGIGIDELQELIEIGVNLGMWLKRSGAWYKFAGTDGEKNIQGVENLYEHFTANPADYALLKEHVNSIFKPKGDDA